MDEREKRWWLQPLSYGYVGPRQATGLLQQEVLPATEPVIGLAGPLPTYEVPTYQPVSAPFVPAQWDAVADTVVANALENQAIAAYESLPTTPIAEPTVSIGLSDATTLPDPTFGLAASDPSLQGLTPFSTASTEMSPAQINARMAEVADAIQHVDASYGNETIVSDKDPSIRSAAKAITSKLPNWAISLGMKYGVPGTGFAGDRIETATTADSMVDILNNRVIMNAKKAGIPKDDLITSIITGVNPLIQTSEEPLAAAAEYVSKGGKLDQDDARQMAFQVDEFLGTVPATTPSTISKVSRPSTKKAAIGTKKNKAEEREKARMRALAKQQAAAQRKRDIAKAKAAKAQDARIQAAIERAAQAQAERAMVSRAKALMNSKSYQESGLDGLSPAERDIVAAAQVDTFAGMGDRTGEVRDAMRSVGYGGSNWT